MAYIAANTALNFSTLDINWFQRNYMSSFFGNNANVTYYGTVYQDVIHITATEGHFMNLRLGGTDLQVLFSGEVLGGTINTFIEYDVDLGTFTYRFAGLNIDAAAFYAAYLTADTADELALIQADMAGDDTMDLSNFGDVMFGFGGNDSIAGNRGADSLDGGDGNDTIDAGGGNDTVIGAGGADSLLGSGGNDSLDAGDGDDVAIGGTGNDWLSGGLGFDYLAGAGNDDTLLGGDGSDTISGGFGLDAIHGDADDDALYGDAGADTLSGGAGNDALFGGNHGDTLLGDDGDDQIVGGLGRDVMSGGTGADTFSWNVNDFGPTLRGGADQITDFSQADGDLIDLFMFDASTTAAGNNAFNWIGQAAFTGVGGQLRYVGAGGNTYIEGDRNGDSLADWAIRLDGSISLVAADFIL